MQDSERILILAPAGRDAAVVQRVLDAHSIESAVCASENALVDQLQVGAGAAFVVEESLSTELARLTAWIRQQPPWSDFPFVVLVARRVGRRPKAASGALADLGNVVLLERPLNAETLVTAATSALRGRARQYAARRYIQKEAESRSAEGLAKVEALSAKQALEVAVDAGELGTFHCPFPIGRMECSLRCRHHLRLPVAADLTLDRFYSAVHRDDQALVREALQRAVDGSAEYEVAFRTLSTDGGIRWIRAKGRVYRDGAGKPSRFDGVTFDITRQKLLEAEREELLAAERQARLEAEQAGRMKDEFLATLSHELRTPLSAILGWTYLLGRPGAGAMDVAKAASTIERNARAQARLIEELLDVSRITSGNLKLSLETVEVATIFDAVVQSLRPAAQAKEISVDVTTSPLSIGLLADAGRLQQVVWNLVSNAIKFTGTGGRVSLAASEEHNEVVLSVADTGLGIAPEFLPHVFERFRQADSTESRSYGGLGLGLAIVRQLVELHGGTVNAHSDGLGHGSTFVVRLPSARATARSGDAGHEVINVPAGAGRDLAGVTILVVDDDDDGREMLATILTDLGAEVAQAASADAAICKLEHHAPHLLISDIGMPKVDGYEFARRVRALERVDLNRIPAIALTAFARPEDALKAREAGFNAHLAKPVDPLQLRSSIAQLLKEGT
jgi:signal transduction histidine kinase